MHMLAARACYLLLPVTGLLVVLTVYSPFHSQADLLWLSCAGTAGQARHSTLPGSDAEGQTSQPEVGNTGRNPPQSRFFSCTQGPAPKSRRGGQRKRVLDSDDMAVGMCPTFARCSSLIVSVCLQISEFDSLGDWEHFRDNHTYGFATHRDRRGDMGARKSKRGWVPMLLA